MDCLRIHEGTNIPVVFDTHHHECYQLRHPKEILPSMDILIPQILQTWKYSNIRPKFHVSEQGEGKIGHHSIYIENIPSYLLEIPQRYETNIDIMIEAKGKEKAVLQCMYGKESKEKI